MRRIDIWMRAPMRIPSTFRMQSVHRIPPASAACSSLLSASVGLKVHAYAIAPVTIAAFPNTALSQYIHTVWNPAKSPNASRANT